MPEFWVIYRCSTLCDDDCEAICHEVHVPFWQRSRREHHHVNVCLANLNGLVNR